ncbi:MAG TPA: PEP-CTERM sorting domain-containing protein [Terriglobia bacterium]|nr:PEP-CTERM sorting domain-containing protein [Terriglobia bacterium]
MLKRNRLIAMLVLLVLALSAPVFGQSVAANSIWNGGTGAWNSVVNWTTNGQLALAVPNNGNTLTCGTQSCKGFFNVTVASGGTDFVTLDTLPVTIDSLTLGGSTGGAGLTIGSSAADTLTIGDINAPVVAPAQVTLTPRGFLTVDAGSTLNLYIAAGNGTVTNNGQISLDAASGTGSTLLINDAGNAHQLTLSGSGTLTMQTGSAIRGVNGDEMLINLSTIQGAGAISNLAVINSGPAGAIVANGALTIQPNPNASNTAGVGPNNFGFLNSGTVTSASGGRLVVDLTKSHTAAFPLANLGVINVNDGGTLTIIGLANNSTTLLDYSGGQINVGGTGNGSTLELQGSNATFDLAAAGNGAGTMTLSQNGNGSIVGVTGTETLVNDVGETLSGAGHITDLALVNNGAIIASGANSLIITPNAGGFTNLGTVTVDSGSFFGIDASVPTAAGNQGLSNSGTISVADGSTLAIGDFSMTSTNAVTLVNNGAINVGGLGAGGEIEFFGTNNNAFKLEGSGAVNLSDNINNQIKGSSGNENLIVEIGQTLQGSGIISNLSLANAGTIIAGPAAPLVIEPDVNTAAEGILPAGSYGFANGGAVEVNASGDLVLTATSPSQSPTLGTVVNLGAITVNDGGTMELDGAPGTTFGMVNTESAQINVGGAGVGAKLELNGSNSIFDLNDGGFQNNGAPATGTLTLSDNANNIVTGVTGTETLVNDVGETLSGAGTVENLALVNKGAILAGGTNALAITPNANGFTNAGTVTVNSGSTLVVNLTNATAGTGFSNSGTVNVQDGGTLSIIDLTPGSTATVNNFQGAINVGQAMGAVLSLEDNGQGATFDLMASNGVFGVGNVTMANSTIAGVVGDETLINDFANTIEGTGTISNLTFTNNSNVVANGGTLAINAKLTNLSGGTLTGGTFEAGDVSPGILQLSGDVTTNSSFLLLVGSGSAITDTTGKNALAGVSQNVNGGNIAIDGDASLTINTSLTNGSPASPSGIIQLTNGGLLTIKGNLTNWDQIVTGESEGAAPTGSTINVSGEVINNFRAGDVEDFIELHAAGDVLKAESFNNSATVVIGSGAKIALDTSYTQTGGSTEVDGTLMSPAITVTGGTLTSGGGLIETQSLTNGTSIMVDSTGFVGVGHGTFTATNGYQQLANGTLDELIASPTSFGAIDVTGPASLDGTLDVTLENGFTPTVGEQFAFLDFTSGDLSGMFVNFIDQTFDNGIEKWAITYNNAGGEVLLTAETNTTSQTPEPASLLLLGTGLLGMALLARKRWTSVRGVPKL